MTWAGEVSLDNVYQMAVTDIQLCWVQELPGLSELLKSLNKVLWELSQEHVSLKRPGKLYTQV